MRQEDINRLMERFMDGMTSLDEEARLADYFRNATDNDRPAGMDTADWQAWREMFRQFDEGFDTACKAPERRRKRLMPMVWKAAAAIVLICGTALTLTRKEGPGTEKALVAQADTTSVCDTPVAADSVMPDTSKDRKPVRQPKKTVKRQPKHDRPYVQKVPRLLMAENGAEPDTADIEAMHSDSIMMAVREAEALVDAMIIYQNMQISDICDIGLDSDAEEETEYEEEEVY